MCHVTLQRLQWSYLQWIWSLDSSFFFFSWVRPSSLLVKTTELTQLKLLQLKEVDVTGDADETDDDAVTLRRDATHNLFLSSCDQWIKTAFWKKFKKRRRNELEETTSLLRSNDLHRGTSLEANWTNVTAPPSEGAVSFWFIFCFSFVILRVTICAQWQTFSKNIPVKIRVCESISYFITATLQVTLKAKTQHLKQPKQTCCWYLVAVLDLRHSWSRNNGSADHMIWFEGWTYLEEKSKMLQMSGHSVFSGSTSWLTLSSYLPYVVMNTCQPRAGRVGGGSRGNRPQRGSVTVTVKVEKMWTNLTNSHVILLVLRFNEICQEIRMIHQLGEVTFHLLREQTRDVVVIFNAATKGTKWKLYQQQLTDTKLMSKSVNEV